MALRRPSVPDENLSRFIDELLTQLNPLLKWADNFPQRYTTASLPVASSSYAGQIVRLKDAGQNEHLLFCREKADGTFAWAQLD